MTFVNFQNGAISRLLRTLRRNAAEYDVAMDVLGHDERSWASATFAGHRLLLTVALEGGDAAGWLAALPQAELPVRGAFVADLAVARPGANVASLAILLVDDR